MSIIIEHADRLSRTVVGLYCAALLALYPTHIDAAPDNTESGNAIIHAYIVAHPDDWQLFMGDEAYVQLANGDRVVFLYLSAGGADRPAEYWHARELGAQASVDAALVKKGASAPADCQQITIELRPLWHCKQANTGSYFLRLPDGNINGSGYAQHGHQSLDKLAAGQAIAAVDGSTEYTSLADLQQTVLTVLQREWTAMPQAQLVLHTHDPALMSNRYDHADHRLTGSIVASIAAELNVNAMYYAGYGIAELPANLPDAAVESKKLLFAAYDRQPILVNPAWSAFAEWPEAYSAWLLRTYRRTETKQTLSPGKLR